MKKKVKNCVSCDLPCIGSHCTLADGEEHICDKCEDTFYSSELYKYGGGEYCTECLLTVLTEDGVIA